VSEVLHGGFHDLVTHTVIGRATPRESFEGFSHGLSLALGFLIDNK
jgi:hypothetical protein